MYALKDETGKITGFTRWPNTQSDVKVDESSGEWLSYLGREAEAKRMSEARGSTSDIIIDVLLAKGLIAESSLTQGEQDGLARRIAKRAT
jgi:hypothetical protein